MKTTIVLFMAIALTVSGRAAALECQAKVLLPTKDDLGNAWMPGQILPMDIARDDPHGGLFCAHGGSCIPRVVNGAVASRILNCRIGPALGGGDYKLVFTHER